MSTAWRDWMKPCRQCDMPADSDRYPGLCRLCESDELIEEARLAAKHAAAAERREQA